MKILRDGDLRKLIKYKKFGCSACGCVFVADPTEYSNMSNQHDGICFVSACPCCNSVVYSYSEAYVDENGDEI